MLTLRDASSDTVEFQHIAPVAQWIEQPPPKLKRPAPSLPY